MVSTLETPRFELPLLAAGQAHKEFFHNDALLLLDFLVHPIVQAVAENPDGLSPENGQAWLVASAGAGLWSDVPHHIALWTGGGWRYIKPQESMKIIILSDAVTAIYRGNDWQLFSEIESPQGGGNVDIEARAAIDSILARLRETQFLPPIN
ncbi:MAG: DUF2793 domain-containing protein [Parasphingorhabdus sp.]|uniref:DUF2793 domain-containing protein n=1 Tax=Parasphingorhabdus sp. TaxID=2709688 RepID=UPI0032988B75